MAKNNTVKETTPAQSTEAPEVTSAQETKVESTTPEEPADETPATETSTENKPAVAPQETVVLATTSPTPLVTTPDAAALVSSLVTDVAEEDNEHVTTLKIQLAAFSREVMKPGNNPQDFKQAAKLAAQITKHVIQYPKVPVLDTLYNFFKENITEACAAENYYKGATTLTATEEQQVAYLYNLFAGLAQGLKVSVNTALVNNVLKKPEIINYYHRRLAGLTQNN